MQLGIIAPSDDIEFISEHTDFDVAMGYMAMRYNEYLRIIQGQKFLGRDIYLLQQPSNIIRDDYYFATARRTQPKLMATTPQMDAAQQYECYMAYVQAARDVKELKDTTIIPYITNRDDERNVAIYSGTDQDHFVQWDTLQNLPLKFVHSGIVVGYPGIEELQRTRPKALITAWPIILAQMGLMFTIDHDHATGPNLTLTPDWFCVPLTDDALALAMENIKELRNAIANR